MTRLATLSEQISNRYRGFFGQAGYGTDAVDGGVPIALRVGVITNTVLGLVGIVFLMITVYSGIQWMTAGGNEEMVKKARTRITRATIGLAIVLGAWVITQFIVRAAFGPLRSGGGAIRIF